MDYLAELEKFGLIEKKKRGLGLPNLIYVKSFLVQQRYYGSTETGTSVKNSDIYGSIEMGTSEVTEKHLGSYRINTSEVSETTFRRFPKQYLLIIRLIRITVIRVISNRIISGQIMMGYDVNREHRQ